MFAHTIHEGLSLVAVCGARNFYAAAKHRLKFRPLHANPHHAQCVWRGTPVHLQILPLRDPHHSFHSRRGPLRLSAVRRRSDVQHCERVCSTKRGNPGQAMRNRIACVINRFVLSSLSFTSSERLSWIAAHPADARNDKVGHTHLVKVSANIMKKSKNQAGNARLN